MKIEMYPHNFCFIPNRQISPRFLGLKYLPNNIGSETKLLLLFFAINKHVYILKVYILVFNPKNSTSKTPRLFLLKFVPKNFWLKTSEFDPYWILKDKKNIKTHI